MEHFAQLSDEDWRDARSLRNVTLQTVGNGTGLAGLLNSLAENPILLNSVRDKTVEVIIREVKAAERR